MDEQFEKALKFVLSLEGGYSNNPSDKGGATNFGITQGTYNAYRRSVDKKMQDVKLITKEEAEQIYYKEYWIKSGANKLGNFALALVLFDSAVNHGVKNAKAFYSKSENNVYKFLDIRREKYRQIVFTNPSQQVFLKGWLNRINKLEKYIKSL